MAASNVGQWWVFRNTHTRRKAGTTRQDSCWLRMPLSGTIIRDNYGIFRDYFEYVARADLHSVRAVCVYVCTSIAPVLKYVNAELLLRQRSLSNQFSMAIREWCWSGRFDSKAFKQVTAA